MFFSVDERNMFVLELLLLFRVISPLKAERDVSCNSTTVVSIEGFPLVHWA